MALVFCLLTEGVSASGGVDGIHKESANMREIRMSTPNANSHPSTRSVSAKSDLLTCAPKRVSRLLLTAARIKSTGSNRLEAHNHQTIILTRYLAINSYTLDPQALSIAKVRMEKLMATTARISIRPENVRSQLILSALTGHTALAQPSHIL